MFLRVVNLKKCDNVVKNGSLGPLDLHVSYAGSSITSLHENGSIWVIFSSMGQLGKIQNIAKRRNYCPLEE